MRRDDDDLDPEPARPAVPTLLWVLLSLLVIGLFVAMVFAVGSS
jgi:hypothetical protein